MPVLALECPLRQSAGAREAQTAQRGVAILTSELRRLVIKGSALYAFPRASWKPKSHDSPVRAS